MGAFSEPYYISANEVSNAIASSDPFRTVQLLQMDEAFKIDLFLLRGTEYEVSELQRARKIEIAPGVRVSFYAPENIVIAKLRWYVLENQVSDRQWNDIVQVLEVQQQNLDSQYLNQWADHFGILELLAAAQTQVVSYAPKLTSSQVEQAKQVPETD
jgi:hypothetical protein